MRNIIIYSIIAVLIYSCGRHQPAPNEIVLDSFAGKPKDIDISAIAAHIDYIRLESIPESLIGDITKIEIKNDRIYVLDRDNSFLFMFDMDGKFIRQFGSRGNGPGEHLGLADFALSDSVVFAADLMQARFILYDTLGRFITQKFMVPYPKKVAFLNGMPIGQYNHPEFVGNNGYRISLFDRNLDIVAHLLKSSINEKDVRQEHGSHSMSFFTRVDDTLTFWEIRDNVVYKIIDENRIEERYRIRYKNPAKIGDRFTFRDAATNEMYKVIETRDLLFILGFYEDKQCRLVYFKKSGTGINVGDGFKNSSGPDFFPDGVTESGKLWSTFSVYSYKTNSFRTRSEKISTPFDQLDPKLQSLIRTSNFDDNPTIMLVTLK
jgi:hypothetical protein